MSKSTTNGYRPQSADTDAETDRRMFAAWAAMTPAAKLAIVADLNRAAEQFAMAGLRLRHPAASEAELRERLAVQRLGLEPMRAILGREPVS